MAIASNRLATLALWQNRLVLTLGTLLFTMIASKAIFSPVEYGISRDFVLKSGVAVTDMRAGDGGFPLVLGLLCLYCLTSTKRHALGLACLGTAVFVILVIRVFGAAVDSSFAQSVRLIVPETVMTFFCAAGLFLRKRADALGGGTR